jgi:cbb3-type cytochrome oxidase maturation protein
MSVIIILIFASLAVALLFLGGFIWSVRSGQYEDTLTPSMRILMEEDRATKSLQSASATLPLTLTLSRREREQQAPTLISSDVSPAIPDSPSLQDQRAILPLPAGEGRGEGEPCAIKTEDDSPKRDRARKRFTEIL